MTYRGVAAGSWLRAGAGAHSVSPRIARLVGSGVARVVSSEVAKCTASASKAAAAAPSPGRTRTSCPQSNASETAVRAGTWGLQRSEPNISARPVEVAADLDRHRA